MSDAVRRAAQPLVAVLLALAMAGPAAAAKARIQYLSSASVYLDAGAAAGLAEGMSVQVERDGKVIAELVVEFVAQNSASCRVQSSTATLRPNDVVSFTPAVAAAPAAVPLPAAPIRAGTWSHRGRLGVLFLRSEDVSGRFDNPLLWAELTMNGSEQKQIGFRFRGDAPQQTVFAPAGSSASRQARLYEAALRYRGSLQRLEIEAGRLLPERLELLGSLDGGGLHWRPKAGLRLGVAGGGGTEYQTTAFAAKGAKIGGFFELGGSRRGRATLAVGRVDDPDVTRRQYIQLRSDASLRHLRFYENLEIDLAPQWKKDMGEDGVELTALSLGTQALVHRSFDFSVGYEARRALLVPEQRSLANVAPRDLLHSVRGAARFAFTRQWSLRLGGDVRLQNSNHTESRSVDALVYGSRLGPLTLSLHASVYDAEQAQGDIVDGSLAFPAGSRARIDLAGGSNRSRTADDIAGGSEPESRWGWLRGGIGVEAGHGLWLRGAGEWRSDSQGREFTLELSQQF